MRTFLGGPFDGEPVQWDGDDGFHTIELQNNPERMAIYKLNEAGDYMFVRCDENDLFGWELEPEVQYGPFVHPWMDRLDGQL